MLTMGSGSCLRRAHCSHLSSVVGCFPFVHSWPAFPRMRATGIGVLCHNQLDWASVNSTLYSFLLKATVMRQDDISDCNTPKEVDSPGSPHNRALRSLALDTCCPGVPPDDCGSSCNH